jgi:anti-sigma factor RsiW
MSRSTACPSEERLRALLDGLLSDFDTEALTAHLDDCPACRRRLEGLAGGPDAVGGLASKLRPEPNADSPALRDLLAHLRGGPQSEPTRTVPPAAQETGPNVVGDAPEPSAGAPLPRRIGPYRVEGLVGVGGMGRVLKAFDPSLRRVVAIKLMADSLAANGTARSRFKREAQAAAAVTHEHVVAIHHVSEEENGIPYIVMQYVQGQSLQERIDHGGSLRLREVLRIGTQIASGLAAAHAQGIIHRDIKPSNILLENGVERVKITDFGLARVSHDLAVTASGTIAGTPAYMSPEQARGDDIDHRSDLFSLGGVLYAMCTGEAPFSGGHPLSVLKRVCEAEPRPIRQINPEVPEWLCAIIAKLMAKDPGQRFQSAAEVADLLGRHLAHQQQPTAVPMPAAVAPPSRPRGGRAALAHWSMRVAFGIASAIGIGLFLWGYWVRNELDERWPFSLMMGGTAGLLLMLSWALTPRPQAERGRRAGWQLLLGVTSVLALFAGLYLQGWGHEMKITWPELGILAAVAAFGLWLLVAVARHATATQRSTEHLRPRRWGWLVLICVVLAGLVLLGVPTISHRGTMDPQVAKLGELVITGIEPELSISIEGPGVSGQYSGVAGPILKKSVLPGDYVINAYLSGKMVYTAGVTVEAGKQQVVPLQLPGLGRVHFLLDDASLRITVDDQELPYQRLRYTSDGVELPSGLIRSGNHHWSAAKEGKEIDKGDFVLAGGETRQIRVKPTKPSAGADAELLRHELEGKRESLRIVRARHEAGAAATGELYTAEVDVLETEIRLADAEGRSGDVVQLLRDLEAKRELQLQNARILFEVGRVLQSDVWNAEGKLEEVRQRLLKLGHGPDAGKGKVHVRVRPKEARNAFAPVELIDAQGKSVSGVTMTAAGLAPAEHTFKNVKPGKYTVVSRDAATDEQVSRSVFVEPNKTAEVELNLAEAVVVPPPRPVIPK